jgi:hypothetical protein
MANDFGTMQTRIANEIRRTDLTSEIAQEIQDAIKFYAGERLWFSESRSSTFTTVASQEFYTSADLATIPNIYKIDELVITISGNRFPLNRRDWDYLEHVAMNPSTNGQPQDWAYYGQQIRLYPIPDGAYTVRVAGIFDLGTLSASADTNAWMVEGEQLIRAMAKMKLHMNRTHDSESATEAANMVEISLGNLRTKNTAHLSSGRVRPTMF